MPVQSPNRIFSAAASAGFVLTLAYIWRSPCNVVVDTDTRVVASALPTDSAVILGRAVTTNSSSAAEPSTAQTSVPRAACFSLAAASSNLSECFGNGFSNPTSTTGMTILIYTSWLDYMDRMDRYWYDFIDGFVRSVTEGSTGAPSKLDVFGYGFEGWDKTLTGGENIMRRLGCCPDAIIIGARHKNPDEPNWAKVPIVPTECATRSHLVHIGGDCHHGRRNCDELYLKPGIMGSTVIAARHVQHIFEIAYPPPEGRLVAHLPFCVDDNPYDPAQSREIKRAQNSPPSDRSGIVLFGHTNSNMYPMRNILRKLILEGKLPDGRENRPPAYHTGIQMEALCGYDPMQNGLEQSRQMELELLEKMGSARICVFDSMTRQKMIRKFHFSFLTNCVPAADLPQDMPPRYRKAVVELPRNASEDQIAAILSAAYEDTDALRAKVAVGASFLRRYSCQESVKDIVGFVEQRRRVSRGVWVPDGFEISCGSTYPFSKDTPLPWCETR